MPESRRHRNPDSGRNSTRARSPSRTRPRAHRRSSSYDDRHHRHQSHRSEPRSRRSRHHDFDSDYYSSSSSRSPSPPRRPSRLRRAASSILPSISRRRRSPSRDSFVDDEQFSRERRDQAIKAAVTAGAVEAFRQRKRPGGWLGKKGLRVATAAMSAAAIDSAVDRNPRRKGVRNVVGSSLGGLVVDQLANGMGRR